MRKDNLDSTVRAKLETNEHRTLIFVFIISATLLVIMLLSHKWLEPRVLSPKLKEDLTIVALPDFSSYVSVKEKKQAFFDYLSPIVRQQNLKIRYTRDFLESLKIDKGGNSYHNQATLKKLNRLAKSYRVNATSLDLMLKELKVKVNLIPESLVLVQAANESAWGTSRFARQANNLFGQWCYKSGCGIVPSSRKSGSNHEVRKFASPTESVASYMKNLNSHPAYKDLRAIRAELIAQNRSVTGTQLAAGLTQYSQRREAYVDEIVRMIRQNNLE